MLHTRYAPALLLAAALTSACTLQSVDAPLPTGPSERSLSLTITATPDVLPEDGVSQSVVRIIARGPDGQPLPNVSLRIDTVIGSTIVDYGTLSARNVVTNASGEASVIFTAPDAPQVGIDTGAIINISVRQISSDFGSTAASGVSIRLVPETTVTTPGTPRPNFFFSPTTPAVGTRVFFDASSSKDDGTIIRYQWDYGDGEREEGKQTFKDYVVPGNYLITLTVTDNQGKQASVTRAITVSAS